VGVIYLKQTIEDSVTNGDGSDIIVPEIQDQEEK
jgi:hypothetical protein